MPSTNADSAETEWRAALASGNLAAGMAVPILRHLIVGDAGSLCSEEIVARIRGMMRDLARQLLDRSEDAESASHASGQETQRQAALIECLVESRTLMGHLHAQALEWQLVERLQVHLGIDPVLSPLLQQLIASSDPGVSALAMRFLASQARHGQAQRRMKLSLGELPKDALQAAMDAMLSASDKVGTRQMAEAAAARIRVSYDESATRLTLAERLVSSMDEEAKSALAVAEAGAALFISGLAYTSGLARDLVTLSTNDSQAARLALALCASGLGRDAIEEQFAAILPQVPFPQGVEHIDRQQAAAILAGSVSGQAI